MTKTFSKNCLSYLGIDPGKTGGIALVHHRPQGSVASLPSPLVFSMSNKTDQEIWSYLRDTFDQWRIQKVLIERVSSSPQMGVASAFTFGRVTGFVIGLVTALEIPIEFPTPQTWQKAMKCLTKGDKHVSRAKADQLFPTIKKNNQTAESLLIAEYCRRKENGLL